MPRDLPHHWNETLQRALARYDAELLRQVAGHLLGSRQRHTIPELVDKLTAWPANPVTVDRRLKAIDDASHTLLALIGLSRQPTWRLQGLLELLSCLDVADGLAAVRELFEIGLLYPEPSAEKSKLKDFDDWLARAGARRLFVHPLVSARAIHAGLRLPGRPKGMTSVTHRREADGLECFLRLGVLWQQARASPYRLTQQGEFFKRDHDRLANDPLQAGPWPDGAAMLPHPGHFLALLGLEVGLLRRDDLQIVAGELPCEWQQAPVEALVSLWSALPALDGWNADSGWTGLATQAQPYASAGLLAIGLLAALEAHEWLRPKAVGRWIAARHCFWREQDEDVLDAWAERFLLGVGYALRLVELARDEEGETVARLSAMGRAVLALAAPSAQSDFPKTLLVQPNLEIIAYRHGLSPGLIGTLSRFANWTALGAACTLKLQPESVYRGLETGATLETILQTLQQRGVKEAPDPVLQSLRTWADKRERLTVYSAAVLLEFASVEELEAALGRGLAGERVSGRFLLIAREEDIDYRHLRLAGTRDYSLPPGQCVDVAEDGVTLSVDLARADLLLETEIGRFAQAVPEVNVNGRRLYRLTPVSLAAARESGWSVRRLEEWFPQRTGQPLSPAARLLLAGPDAPPLRIERRVVIEVGDPCLADGLLQWPETSALIEARLGPQALAVAEDRVSELAEKLQTLGWPFRDEASSPPLNKGGLGGVASPPPHSSPPRSPE